MDVDQELESDGEPTPATTPDEAVDNLGAFVSRYIDSGRTELDPVIRLVHLLEHNPPTGDDSDREYAVTPERRAELTSMARCRRLPSWTQRSGLQRNSVALLAVRTTVEDLATSESIDECLALMEFIARAVADTQEVDDTASIDESRSAVVVATEAFRYSRGDLDTAAKVWSGDSGDVKVPLSVLCSRSESSQAVTAIIRSIGTTERTKPVPPITARSR